MENKRYNNLKTNYFTSKEVTRLLVIIQQFNNVLNILTRYWKCRDSFNNYSFSDWRVMRKSANSTLKYKQNAVILLCYLRFRFVNHQNRLIDRYLRFITTSVHVSNTQ